MNKHAYNQANNDLVRFVSPEVGSIRYGLGRTKLVQVAKEYGAFYKIGRSARIDVCKLDKAITDKCEV